MEKLFPITELSQTESIAKQLAEQLEKGDVLALYGDLGTGKTHFTKRLCHYFDVQENVSSPSFVIMNEYCGKLPVFHFDFYRLASEEEVFELGISDILEEGITIIEWPELAIEWLPPKTIHLHFTQDCNERKLKIQSKKEITIKKG